MLSITLKNLITGLVLLISTFTQTSHADLIKPAIVEITSQTDGIVKIELLTSIEALLTQMGYKYKNTKESPNEKQYNIYRNLTPKQLKPYFNKFKSTLLSKIYLKADQKTIPLKIISTKIPQVGYPKVPRISTIIIHANIDKKTEKIQWFYPLSFGDSVVTFKQVNLKKNEWVFSSAQWLKNNQPSKEFSLKKLAPKTTVIGSIIDYIVIGIKHIIPRGTDHILFILGLFLFSSQLRPLLLQITMFTIAHSITLGLAYANIIHLPAKIVEPLIALSIVYIAIENILIKKIYWHRLILIFSFGILHGLGFADVLKDFKLSDSSFFISLISFNIGVELGQLIIVLLAYFIISWKFKDKIWYHKLLITPISVIISMIGFYWFLERILVI